MARIALLTRHTPLIEDDNYSRLAACLAAEGHEVTCLLIDTLKLDSDSRAILSADGFQWDENHAAGIAFPDCEHRALDQDLVWLLSLGERATFLDKMQLLRLLAEKQILINSVDAVMHIRSKYFLASQPDLFKTPQTHAARDPAFLAKIIRHQGGKWIVKPPAGSLGREVFLTEANDGNLLAILAAVCGHEGQHYAMIQRYVPEIAAGEKRVLLAGGEIVGQYLRQAPDGDHRTNLSQQGIAEPCDLTQEETEGLLKMAQQLEKRGAWFSGVDIVWPWLIEVNVVNPGGIVTIDSLTGKDLTPRLARILNERFLT